MSLWETLFRPECWQEFLEYKMQKQHLSETQRQELQAYIEAKRYLSVLEQIENDKEELPLPYRKEVNKSGASKKRVVYCFPQDFNILLKMIAYRLFSYDFMFEDNCYAFRRSYGAKNAVRRLRHTGNLTQKYCLKVDLSNYFNSIDIPLLLHKMEFMKAQDAKLFDFLKRLLTQDQAIVMESGNEVIVREKRGAMAGTPISPFLANVYLRDVDAWFAGQEVLYFRYSDDILLLADSMEELEKRRIQLYQKINEHMLTLNPDKVHISRPEEAFEFLGFRFDGNEVDLSDITVQKIKAKIKRKSHALRRWQIKKKLPPEKATKGFIRAMNRKFYDNGSGTEFFMEPMVFSVYHDRHALKDRGRVLAAVYSVLCNGAALQGELSSYV